MFSEAVRDTSRAIITAILTDANLPVERCHTPDTRNAVCCLVEQCWLTEGMEPAFTQNCQAHVGLFAVPIVRLVRINANGRDSIPAHVLVQVGNLIINRYTLWVAGKS